MAFPSEDHTAIPFRPGSLPDYWKEAPSFELQLESLSGLSVDAVESLNPRERRRRESALGKQGAAVGRPMRLERVDPRHRQPETALLASSDEADPEDT